MTQSTEVKATDVQKLRQTTGAGMMECKKALQDASGDFEKAIQLLRERGIAKSSKRADRAAAEGIIDFWISPDQKEGILLELNCETDFVARNSEFINLAKYYLGYVQSNSQITTAEQIPIEKLEEFSGKVGEKMGIRRFVRFRTNSGIVAPYIHSGSKLGVLVQIDSNKGVTSELSLLSKEITLQIAGANPLYLTKDEVPQEILEREKDIAKKQMADQKKPPEILEKIAVGKLQQFFDANCLVDQPHIKDGSGKTKMKDLVEATQQKEGSQIKIIKFVRFRVGAE
ncbi:MAG: translation elongation factor Ts [Elusimicrobiota bacterium]